MIMSVRCGIALALVLGAVAPVWAQSARAISLEEAVQLAVDHAPRLAEARARESAAASTVTAREAARRPTLTAATGYLRTNHVEEFGLPQAGGGTRIIFPDIPDNYRLRAELGVPLLTGGRVEGLLEAARADTRAVAADRRVVEQEVRLEVIRSYWSVVTAQEQVRVLTQALARADASVSDVKARVEAGVLPPNDLLSAQAQRARQNVRLIESRNAAAVMEMDLARLIGEDIGRPLTLTSAVDRPLAGIAVLGDPTADRLVALARERRAERDGLTERQAGLRSAAAAALAALRPQVFGVAAVEPARPNPRFVPRVEDWRTSWDLGVNLTWPLFDGGRARAEHASTLAQADAVGHRLRDFDARVALEVRQRLLDLESGRAALTASSEAVAAAAEARRVVEERFRAGVATSTDVLDAQLALLEAELEGTRLAATLRVAEARLLRAVGAL